MSRIIVFYVLFYFYLISICKGSDLSSDRVRSYDSESFKANVGGSIPHFINIFTPWCRSDKRLKPVTDELAEKHNVDSPNQKLVTGQVENHRGARSLQFITEMEDAHEERLVNEERNIPDYVDSSMPPDGSLVVTTFGEPTQENFQSTVSHGLHFVKFCDPWCGSSAMMEPAWEELAENFENDTSVTISSVDCRKHRKACQEFEVHRYPTFLWIVDGIALEEYHGAKNLESFKQFITEMKESLKKWLEFSEENIPDYFDSSMPPGVSSEETTAQELTDENFQSTISRGLHFVKFYSPWCGYSIMMEPAWEELAKNLQNDTSVTISSVDCTEHGKACQEFEVDRYPTLWWIADGKEVEKYHGARNVESFKRFITEMKIAHEEWLRYEARNISDSVDSSATIPSWSKLLYIASALYFGGAILYFIFASGEEQPWGRNLKEEEEKEQSMAETVGCHSR